ncbi:hypothetical protein [Thermoleptolyngbya sp.]
MKLLKPLSVYSFSVYSFNEAKLLCEDPSGRWVAWVPDHGEVMLNRSDFYY